MTQTTRRTVLRRIGWTMLTLASIVVIAAFATLSRARVEMTEGGAYTRLLLPVVRGAIGVRVYSGGGEQVALPGYLAGPMVRRGTDGRWSAKWFCADAVQRATGQGPSLQVTCDGAGFSPDAAAGGFGLSGMAERAELVGGHLDVRSGRGRGTTIEARIPVTPPR